MVLPTIVLMSAFASVQPAPSAQATASPAAAATDSAQSHIDAGLKLFVRHQFAQAQGEFEKAQAADPQSAAATFYLAYTMYKIAEPKRPFHPEKQQAAQMFAKAFSLDPNFKPVWGTATAPKK